MYFDYLFNAVFRRKSTLQNKSQIYSNSVQFYEDRFCVVTVKMYTFVKVVWQRKSTCFKDMRGRDVEDVAEPPAKCKDYFLIFLYYSLGRPQTKPETKAETGSVKFSLLVCWFKFKFKSPAPFL